MKIDEFKKPVPLKITLEETLSNDFTAYCQPRKVYIPPEPIKQVDKLTQEITEEFKLYDINSYKAPVDFFELAQCDYEKYLLEYPEKVTEGIEHNRNKYTNLVNTIFKSISSEIPIIGNLYCVLSVQAMVSQDGPMFTMGGSEKALTLTSIDKKTANNINYIQYKFNDTVGGEITFPKEFVVGDRYLKTFLLTDDSLIKQFRTYINLTLDNNWYVTDRIINESWLFEDGRIVQGSNTTDDVGLDEITKQAKKVGFTVTRDGVPALLTSNGAHPNPVVVESKITEINMGTKNLQKQIDSIYEKVTPVIGFEMEVCKQPGDKIYNDIRIDNTMDLYDLAQFFNNNDEEDFEKLTLPYAKWIKKQDPQFADEIWTHDKIVNANGMGDRDLSFGAFLNANNYHSAMDLYYDNQEWLEEPYEDEVSGSYNFGEAKATAEEMDGYGIDAEVEETYHSGNRPDDAWVIEPDDSIRPNPGDVGMEIISSPQDYNDGLLEFQDMCAMMRDGSYYTNETTGLHINVSIDGIDFEDLDYTKLVLLSGDSHVLQQFDRNMNNYTNHALAGLNDYFKPSGGGQAKEQGERKVEMLINSMRDGFDNVGKDLIGNIDVGGHVSIIIKHGYIEFRSAGNTDYEYNDQAIINAVNRFIVALVAASDTELYRKEYAKKLYKMLSAHLPAGNERLNQHAMQLFSMHQSGMFDQARLKEKLKDLGQERQKLKEPSTKPLMDKIIKGLKNHYGDEFSTDSYIGLATDGLEKEMKKTEDPEQAVRNVIRNISDDHHWYSRANNI